MSLSISHATKTGQANHSTVQSVNVGDPVDLSANAWNEDHLMTGWNSGNFVVFANTTSRTINHGLAGGIPKVTLTPRNQYAAMYFVTNINVTQFTVNLLTSQEVDSEFDWEAKLI